MTVQLPRDGHSKRRRQALSREGLGIRPSHLQLGALFGARAGSPGSLGQIPDLPEGEGVLGNSIESRQRVPIILFVSQFPEEPFLDVKNSKDMPANPDFGIGRSADLKRFELAGICLQKANIWLFLR